MQVEAQLRATRRGQGKLPAMGKKNREPMPRLPTKTVTFSAFCNADLSLSERHRSRKATTGVSVMQTDSVSLPFFHKTTLAASLFRCNPIRYEEPLYSRPPLKPQRTEQSTAKHQSTQARSEDSLKSPRGQSGESKAGTSISQKERRLCSLEAIHRAGKLPCEASVLS